MPTALGYRHMRDRARELRREQTPAEKCLWTVLRGNQCGGLRFLRQRPIGQYIVDFYCPARRLAIEVDGSIHDETEVWTHDAMRQNTLEELGITVIRLSNEDVLTLPTDQLKACILAVLPPVQAF
jgi:very-short-patch-repair endonuclease